MSLKEPTNCYLQELYLMACSIFTTTYHNVKRNKETNFVPNKSIHVNDYVEGYTTRPAFKKVLDVFEVKITKERQRKIILDNGITLVCSDNHALICKEDGRLFDVFPDELLSTHKVVTSKGLAKVEHVYMMTKESTSNRFLDIIVEDSYYFCGSNPEQGLVLCYN